MLTVSLQHIDKEAVRSQMLTISYYSMFIRKRVTGVDISHYSMLIRKLLGHRC